MLLITHLITVLLFIILGIVFSRGKGSFLIAGYNTASKAEKAKTNEKELCRFVGKMMFVLAGCWLFIASSEIFGTMVLLWIGLGLFFTVIISGIIYMNTGNRFRM